MRYFVKIPAVLKNKSAVTQFIIRLLGPENYGEVQRLIQDGGIVIEGLNESAARAAENQLRRLGVDAQMIDMEDKEISNDQDVRGGYTVILLDAGDNKIAVVKVIREITGLGLKESKELADNAGKIISLKTREEAYNVKKKLTSVGAKVSIANNKEVESADSVMFSARINGNPAEFLINLDGDVTDLDRVSEIKFGRASEIDNNLNTLFSLSVSDADMSKLEGLTMIVKYKF